MADAAQILREMRKNKEQEEKSDFVITGVAFCVIVVGTVALFLFLVAYSLLAWGFALTHLWRWFVVPVFHAPALAMWQAVGLLVVASCFKDHSGPRGKDG